MSLWRWFLTMTVASIAVASPLERPSSPGFLSQTGLSSLEKQELGTRLQRFFARPLDPMVMNQPVPKYSLSRGTFVEPHARFRGTWGNESPLARLAGVKATPSFERAYCRNFLERRFPGIRCDGHSADWAAIEAADRVENLAPTWMNSSDLTYSLGEIPTQGKTSLDIWSGDYWPLQSGGISYRYSAGEDYDNYEKAIAAYSQPREWHELLSQLDPTRIAEKVANWSPAEKYDLAVGDQRFTLTREQKREGNFVRDDDGKVPDWMGTCDGWAAAAVSVARPAKPVQVEGARGVKITWNPADIRALLNLAWSNGDYGTNYIGTRCNRKILEIYGNGRLVQQECFDDNPATFHLALGNLVGRAKATFIMDSSFDYQVWNQPIVSYELTYFNPLDSKKTSSDWAKVAVPYDDVFKDADRFQEPLTRGVRHGKKYDDSGIKKIVGVIASVTYADEVPATDQNAHPDAVNLDRESYTYDLELSQVDGKLEPTGGEWYQNGHPDFMWLPHRGDVASSKHDQFFGEYDGSTEPVAGLTLAARSASGSAIPLCAVMSHLEETSSRKADYRCSPGR